MRLFVKKVLFFLCFLCLILILKKLFTPYNWGNYDFDTKLTFFIENKENENFNTIFFGSSRIYRQVNTVYFDSLLKDLDIKSFNFSTPATFNPEAFFLYENFINKQYSKDIKYAFIELQDLKHLENSNIKTTKSSYWNNFYFFNYSINYILNSDLKFKSKLIKILSYFKSFLYGFTDFEFFKKEAPLDKRKSKKRIGVQGFYSLDKELAETAGKNSFYKRWSEFNSDTTILSERIDGFYKAKKINSSKNFINQYYLTYLNNLIEKSKKKGISLIFILPPRLTEKEYIELLPIANSLPPNNIIKLHDPDKFKDLYLAKNSFDIGHLNAAGANIFTKNLADEFKKISIQN